MRSILMLVLVWLALQYAALLVDRARSHGGSVVTASHSAMDLDSLLNGWPDGSRRMAHNMMSLYGAPDGVFDDVLRWNCPGGAALVLYRGGERREPEQARQQQQARRGSIGSSHYRPLFHPAMAEADPAR